MSRASHGSPPSAVGRSDARAAGPREDASPPATVVLSALFPHSGQPFAGLFIRERMFRVGRRLPVTFVVPVPWFPFQGLIRRFRAGFRPPAPVHEVRDGYEIYYPRFFSFPGVLKRFDGLLMALGVFPRLRRLARAGRCAIIDSHFGYPDGHAASLLGRWLSVPFTVTLRGNETAKAREPGLGEHLRATFARASRIFCVSDSLRRFALSMGAEPDRTLVASNGVDSDRFRPESRTDARSALGIEPSAPVIVTVGGLTPRKGFHRVIETLPALRREFPDLVYLVVGGANPEDDFEARLRAMVDELGVADMVRFLGPVDPDRLRFVHAAADLFVLATAREGWANVLMEAIACGLPIVATSVDGNPEI
ncbi:MAG: glycosyltransferase, partial [Chromatiales bacterium]|nr:glycosyltransferase [Chromatiales bacterium]